MAVHDDNKKIINVPVLYDMMQDIRHELTTKIENSDRENRERDEKNHRELRGIMLGNGKVGFVGRLVRLETQIKIFFTLFIGVCAKLIHGWVT